MVGGQGGFDAGDEVEVEAVGVELLRGVPAGVLEERLRHGGFFPEVLRERDGFPLPGEIGRAADFAGDAGEQRLGVGEDFEIAGVGAVPLEQGEFGVAFAIAAILMIFTMVICLATGLVSRYYKKRRNT